jgi:hypothetical protein
MNEAMQRAWLEISATIEEPTEEDLTRFLRTWAAALRAAGEQK